MAHDVAYVLGHQACEMRRLELQSAVTRPATERLLRETGLSPGMRVLDVGCGVGDMTMLLAELVGTSGAVTGIDREEVAVTTARQRAASAGYAIDYRQADVAARPDLGTFDLVVARFVLVHQPDPVAFMQALASYAGAGGVVAVQEFLATLDLATLARAPLWRRCVELIAAAFSRALPHPDVAMRLADVFHAAGLGGARVFCEVAVDSQSEHSAWFELFSLTVRSLAPFLEQSGLMRMGELDLDTLEQRLREEALSRHDQRIFTPQFCCWSRK